MGVASGVWKRLPVGSSVSHSLRRQYHRVSRSEVKFLSPLIEIVEEQGIAILFVTCRRNSSLN